MSEMRHKRDGAWIVELHVPLQHAGQQLDELRIRPLTMGQLVRWNQEVARSEDGQQVLYAIPSILGLLAELTDLPELLLRQITFPDVDRVMLVFATMMPPVIQAAMSGQTRPMATPDHLLPPTSDPAGRVYDQQDPRFPHVDGPVRRFPAPPVINPPAQPPPQPSAPPGIAQPGEIMKAV